jgi:hypothetical protein
LAPNFHKFLYSNALFWQNFEKFHRGFNIIAVNPSHSVQNLMSFVSFQYLTEVDFVWVDPKNINCVLTYSEDVTWTLYFKKIGKVYLCSTKLAQFPLKTVEYKLFEFDHRFFFYTPPISPGHRPNFGKIQRNYPKNFTAKRLNVQNSVWSNTFGSYCRYIVQLKAGWNGNT